MCRPPFIDGLKKAGLGDAGSIGRPEDAALLPELCSSTAKRLTAGDTRLSTWPAWATRSISCLAFFTSREIQAVRSCISSAKARNTSRS